MSRARPPDIETDLWHGAPSMVTILPIAVLCILFIWLLFPIPVLVYQWLQVRATSYRLTSQRIIVRSGVLSRKVEEVELFRIRDLELHASLLERPFGVATLSLHSTDRTAPTLALEGIADAEAVKEAMRTRIRVLRDTTRRIS